MQPGEERFMTYEASVSLMTFPTVSVAELIESVGRRRKKI